MIADKLLQKCTYWAPGPLDDYGFPSWLPPVVLPCRWEQKQRLIRNKAGAESMSSATVYLAQSVDLQGRLYLGETDAADPLAEGMVGLTFEPQAIETMAGFDPGTAGYKVAI
jgi:hypothetical protein